VTRPPPSYPPYSAYPGYPQGYPGYRPKPVFPHSEPRPYHQMLRTWTWAWWRPVVGIVLVLAGFVLVAPVLAMPILAIDAATMAGDFGSNFSDLASLKVVNAGAMLYLNVSLGLGILVAWAAIRVMHGMRPRWLTSVMPRMRWRFFLVCLGISVVALVAQLVVSLLLPDAAGDEVSGTLKPFTTSSAGVALVVLLTTPFQAAGEEYVFRGYLMQAIGSFVTRPWWRWAAITLTALLFAFAHGLQNAPLFFDRFAFGFIAGWLAVRTGGLEAGIAMHLLNNYLAFGLALAFGDVSDSLTVSSIPWWSILVTVTQSGVYAGLVVYAARRMNLQTRTHPPADVPLPSPA
jgi:uncharacterized protein